MPHCGLPAEDLAPLAVELLEVPEELMQTALDLELAEGTVVGDTVAGTPCIFLGSLYRAERAIGERFLKIAGGKLPWPDIDAGKALPWVEGKTGLSLAASQAEAVGLALTSKTMVILFLPRTRWLHSSAWRRDRAGRRAVSPRPWRPGCAGWR